MATPKEILYQYWGFTDFRDVQEDIVNAVVEKKDVLALLPTGGGKSICYQVPGLMMEGICIVVSPLIALMKDQVEALKSKEIKAAMIYSGMNKRDIDITLDNCIYGNFKFLYISPERIKTDLFQERVQQMTVNLVAVDEAHCISQWGYDFRPAYLEIATLRELLPEVPFVALTATATKAVSTDIIAQLQLKNTALFQKSFVRKNLSFSVFEEEDKERKLVEILKSVPGSAIVYLRSRKGTRDLARLLQTRGFSTVWYHAGMSHEERSKSQEAWVKNKTKVMVATNAFGMGIDKPDVRVVVHMDLPENIESYYQEAGRAGRDEGKAYAVLLYHKKDPEELLEKFHQSHPDIAFMKRVYQSLANYFKLAVGSAFMASFDFDIEDFTRVYQLKPRETYYAVKKLEESGFIQLNESFFNSSRLYIKVDNKALYAFQIANEPYDLLIKAILRVYGGEVFTDFVNIKETALAEIAGISLAECIKKLEALHSMEVAIYDKQKTQPQLTFIQPRFDANSLPLDKKRLDERRDTELHKLGSIFGYLNNPILCRTRFLTEYFGETNYENCGVCDICLRQYRKTITDDDRLQKLIHQHLKEKAYVLEELVANIPGFKKDEIIEVLRNMLDEGLIQYDTEGKLYLKE